MSNSARAAAERYFEESKGIRWVTSCMGDEYWLATLTHAIDRDRAERPGGEKLDPVDLAEAARRSMPCPFPQEDETLTASNKEFPVEVNPDNDRGGELTGWVETRDLMNWQRFHKFESPITVYNTERNRSVRVFLTVEKEKS